MINLSQFGRQSRELTVWQYFSSMRGIDIYQAENIRDIRENAPYLEFPWYKSFSHDHSCHRAAIIVNNVGIELVSDGDAGRWFSVHDDTELMMMVWADGKKTWWYPSISFEQAQEEQGLKENDRVFELFILYLIYPRIPLIIDVKRTNFRTGKESKETILKRLRDYLAVPQIALNPSR